MKACSLEEISLEGQTSMFPSTLSQKQKKKKTQKTKNKKKKTNSHQPKSVPSKVT